jgi:Ca-activated chloride channel homolog
MTFGRPYLLCLLLLLPLLAWLRGRRGRPPAFIYSSVHLLEGLTRITRSRTGGFLAALRWLTLALFFLALTQPRWTRSETKVTASGVDIVVALDMSGSMESEDFVVRGQRVNRLSMAKAVLEKFIERRLNDRIGLVAFGGRAYTACPLTLDHEFLLQSVERLHLHMIEDNTAIGSALATAVNRLRDLKSKSRIVILMTDGQNNAGNIAPLAAAEAAQSLGVKVYTIGVGTRGEAPMPVTDMFGRRGYRNVPVDIDEDTLQEIAKRTGGKYYRAENAEKFQAIYAEIDKLEKTEAEIKKYAQHTELFAWFVLAGLGLLLAEVTLGQTVWRTLP